MLKPSFEIGARVIISDVGCIYTTYPEMAELMKLTNYVYKITDVSDGEQGMVVAQEKHLRDTTKQLYGIRLMGEARDIIMNYKGLKRDKSIPPSAFDEDLFTI